MGNIHCNCRGAGNDYPQFYCRAVSGGWPFYAAYLGNQQRLIVNRFIYHLRAPEKGEILIFKYPKDQSRDFIKRVIAVPGDTIEIKDGNVFVNDELQTENYILSKCRGDYPKVTIPEGHIFVMGDNRNNSEDSRFPDVGFVPFDLIKGKAMVVFWPFADMKVLP